MTAEQSFQVFHRRYGKWAFQFYARGTSAADLKRRIFYARKGDWHLNDIRVDELPDGHPLKKTV